MCRSRVKGCRIILYGIYETNDCIAVGFGEFAELLNAISGIAFRGKSVPHNCFQSGASATVVQTVGSGATGHLLVQATSPQRSGATPTATNIIHHQEFVLHHIGVGPNLLVRIARQFVAFKEIVGVCHFIRPGGPAGSVAIVAPDFAKQLLASNHIGIINVAHSRYGETSVPNHKVGVVVVAHFHIQTLVGEIGSDALFQRAFPIGRMLLVGVDSRNVGFESGLHLGVFGAIFHIGAGSIKIMVAAVGTGHIGNVPNGIGAGAVL